MEFRNAEENEMADLTSEWWSDNYKKAELVA